MLRKYKAPCAARKNATVVNSHKDIRRGWDNVDLLVVSNSSIVVAVLDIVLVVLVVLVLAAAVVVVGFILQKLPAPSSLIKMV